MQSMVARPVYKVLFPASPGVTGVPVSHVPGVDGVVWVDTYQPPAATSESTLRQMLRDTGVLGTDQLSVYCLLDKTHVGNSLESASNDDRVTTMILLSAQRVLNGRCMVEATLDMSSLGIDAMVAWMHGGPKIKLRVSHGRNSACLSPSALESWLWTSKKWEQALFVQGQDGLMFHLAHFLEAASHPGETRGAFQRDLEGHFVLSKRKERAHTFVKFKQNVAKKRRLSETAQEPSVP